MKLSPAGIQSDFLRAGTPTEARPAGYQNIQVHPRTPLPGPAQPGSEKKKRSRIAGPKRAPAICSLGTLEEGPPPSVEINDSSPPPPLCELFLGNQQDQYFECHSISTFVPCENSRAFWRKRRNIQGPTNVWGSESRLSPSSLPFGKGRRRRSAVPSSSSVPQVLALGEKGVTRL